MTRIRSIRLIMVMVALMVSVGSVGVRGASAATLPHPVPAGGIGAAGVPDLGILFVPDGDAGQCTGPQQQWVPGSDWTIPIRLDTDNRFGGCRLAFGVRDTDNTLAGLSLFFLWQAEPGSDAGQCGSQGLYGIPVTPSFTFSSSVRVDTDNRPGWCNLTFFITGRSDIALDVQFWADGDAGQCRNNLPQGQFFTVRNGVAVTLGLDMDNRAGGCNLALRLRRLAF